jgi:uncharacterized membrane protein YciS (DUF1049 family)
LAEQQNFKNHVKRVPGFVFFVVPVGILNLVWSLYAWWNQGFRFGGLVAVLLAAALILAFFYTRIFALRVQDRVIRLEEQLRYQRVLPADLQARCAELSLGQILALRFASDAELAGLMRKVLDEKLADGKAIKMLVTDWRADHLRA